MSTHNICFCGEIRKIAIVFGLKKNALSGARHPENEGIESDWILLRNPICTVLHVVSFSEQPIINKHLFFFLMLSFFLSLFFIINGVL